MKEQVRCIDCQLHKNGICQLTKRAVNPESLRNCKKCLHMNVSTK